MTSSFLSALALALCIAPTGFSPGSANEPPASQPPWRTERLKAGDTTVARTIGARSPAASVVLTREVRIGRSDGRPEETFAEIGSVTPAPDGGVIFYEYGARMVRRFDSAGKYLNSLGRLGDGPGEYRAVSQIEIAPQGRVLLTGQGHFHLFMLNGTPVKDWTMFFPYEPIQIATLSAFTRDGYAHVMRSLWDTRFPDSADARGQRPSTMGVSRVHIDRVQPRIAEDGSMPDTILRPLAPARPRMFEYLSDGNTSRATIPLVPQFITTYSKLGYWISAGDSSRYAITLHTRGGAPLRIESDMERVPAVDAERRWHLYTMAYAIRRYEPTVSPPLDIIPRVKPFFKSLVTDADGRIWVHISRPATRVAIDTLEREAIRQGTARLRAGGGRAGDGGAPPARPPHPAGMRQATEEWVEPETYDVFAPTGDFLGRVTMPARSTFGNAKGDKIWVIERDDLDIPSVVRYRITDSLGGSVAARWR